MPTFSILIAVYNAAPWLDACLHSLSKQTCGDFEALCVDDCSTDESRVVLQEWCAADSRFKAWRTPTNSGQGAARNLALEHATGRYTLFLDADDTLAPDALALLRDAFESRGGASDEEEFSGAGNNAAGNEVDAALLRLVKTWDDGCEEEVPCLIPDRNTHFTGREACVLNVEMKLHGVYAIRTDIHRRLPYITTPRHYADDNTTFLHYLACRRVAVTAATYYYRQHAASETHRDGLAQLDILEANKQLRQLLETANIGRRGLRSCERYCWYTFVSRYAQFLRQRPQLSPQEQAEAHHRFAAALRAMHPSRLGRAALRHPSTLFLRPYGLFRLWQGLLFKVKRLLKHSASIKPLLF